jgi:hypothetical protein
MTFDPDMPEFRIAETEHPVELYSGSSSPCPILAHHKADVPLTLIEARRLIIVEVDSIFPSHCILGQVWQVFELEKLW